MKKLSEIIEKYTKNKDNVSKRDIIFLIMELYGINYIELQLKKENLFDEKIVEGKIEEYYTGKPVEYILGYAYFLNSKYKVTKDTLIPRSETEELVLEIINRNKFEKPRILDVGAGTGCIAISLYNNIKESTIDSVDISNEALEVAKINNELNNTKVNFYYSDCLEEPIKRNCKYDILVSNPPYIDIDEYVQDSVKDYEPYSALFAENHGLAIYSRILNSINKVINDKYLICFEISPLLIDGLKELIEKNLPNSKYEFKKDINGFIRYLFIYN